MFLRYNQTTEIDFFMPDESDPWTGKTGLTTITVQYKKQGQSSFTTLSSPTITEIGNGWYKLSVPTAMTDTYGFLVIRFSATGAKTEQHVYQVVAFNPYDSNLGMPNLDAAVSSRLAASSYTAPDNTSISAIKAQTDKLTFDASNRIHSYVTAVSGGVISASSFSAGAINSTVLADNAITSAKLATDAISSAKIATDAVTKIAGGILQNTSNKLYTGTGGVVQIDMSQAVPSSPSYNTVGYSLRAASDVAEQNVEVLAEISNYTLPGAMQLQSLVSGAVWLIPTTALTGAGTIGQRVSNNLDAAVSSRLAASSYTAPDNTGISNIWNKVQNLSYTESGGNYYVNAYTTNPGSVDYNQIATSVWSAASGTNYGTGAMGTLIKTNLDTTVSSRLAASSYTSPDNASISAIKAQTDKLTFDASNRIHSYVTAISGGVIASGSFAAGAINSTVLADNAITASKIATDAIADTKISSAAVTKIAGGILQDTSNKLYTAAGGAVQLDMGQPLPGTPTTHTVGYSLKASSNIVDQSVYVLAEVDTFTMNGSLDLRNNVFAATWGMQTTALTGAGTIGKRVADNLDVAVSTRLASADYSTSSIAAAVWGYSNRQLTALSTGLAVSVWNVPTANVTAAGSIGLRLRDNIDATVSSRLDASSYVAPDNTSITAIKTQTDKLTFDASNRIHSYVTAVSGGVIASGSFAAGAINSTVLADNAITAAKIATDAIAGAKIASDAVTKIAGGILQNTSNKLYTGTGGVVRIDMSQAVPSSPSYNTVGYSLRAASDVAEQNVEVLAEISNYTLPGAMQLQSLVSGAVWLIPTTALTGTNTIGKKVNDYLDMPVSNAATPVDVAYAVASTPVVLHSSNFSTLVSAVTSGMTSQGYTTSRATKLDNLDVAVSSRLAASSYVTPPSTSDIASAVWAHTTRQITDMTTAAAVAVWHTAASSVTAANTIGLQLKTNIDTTISSRSTLTSGQVQTVFDNQGYTTGRAAKLDNLDATVSSRSTLTAANVWSYTDRQLTALSTGLAISIWNVPSANVTAANTIGLQLKTNVDATISSRSTLTSSDVTTAVWGAASGTNYGTGTMGTLLKTNLDVPVSTRLASASYAAPPTTSDIASAVWTYSTRQITDMNATAALAVWHVPAANVTAANTIGLQVKTNVDAAISSRSTLTTGDVRSAAQQALTDQGYTSTRASKLDYLDGSITGSTSSVWSAQVTELTGDGTIGKYIVTYLDTPVSNAATPVDVSNAMASTPVVLHSSNFSTLVSAVTSGMTVQGYTTSRAPNLDNLDVTVSSRLAASSYVAPPTTGQIANAVWTRSDRQLTAMSTGLALSVWHVPAANVTAANTIGLQIKTNVDTTISSRSTLTSDQVQAVLDNQGYTSTRAGYLDRLDVAVSTRLASADYSTSSIASAVWGYTTRELTSISTGLALSVWHVPAANVTASNSIGLQLKTNIDATVSSRSTLTTGDVRTASMQALTDQGYTTTRATRLDNLDVAVSTRLAASSYTAPPTTSDIAAAVWGHSSRELTAISTGLALSVWNVPTANVTAANSIGLRLRDNVDAAISSRSTLTASQVWSHTDRQLTALSTGLALSVWNVPAANVTGANTIGLQLRNNIDATISSRSTLTVSDVQGALTNQGYTTARAAKLDYLDGSVTGSVDSVWSVQVSELTGDGTIGEYILSYLDMPVSNAATPSDVSNAVAVTPVVLHGSNFSTLVGAVTSGLTLQGYTTARSSNLDNLDVAVSTRLSAAAYTAPPTTSQIASAVWTHADRQLTAFTTGLALNVWHVPAANVTSAGSIGLQVKTNLDAMVSSRSTLTTSDVQTALTNQGYTTTRAGYLDRLDATISSRMPSGSVTVGGYASGQDPATLVWSASTRTLTSFGTLASDTAAAVWGYATRELTSISTGLAVSVWNVPSASVTAANSIGLRLRDNIDVAISTRLAASGYVTPPTTSDVATAVWSHSTRQITDMSPGAALTVWHTPAANVTAANTIGLQLKNNVDSTISSRSTLTLSDVQTAMTNQGYTTTRAAKLDNLDASVSSRSALSSSDVTSAVWAAATGTNYGTGTMGTLVKTNLDAAISSRSTLTTGGVYSATQQAVTDLGYTVSRAAALDNLDVPVSSRLASTGYTAPPTTGQIATAVWSYSTRELTAFSTGLALSVWHVPSANVTASNTIGLRLKNNVDAAISSRSTLAISDVQTALTNQGYTTTRAGYLDRLDVEVSTRLASADYSVSSIAGAVWGYSTRELTALSTGLALSVWSVPSASVTAANSIGLRLRDNIDAAISSRLAAASYVAPDNTTIANVWNKVQNLSYTEYGGNYYVNSYTTNPGSVDYNQIASSVWSYSNRQLSDYSSIAPVVWGYSSRTLTSYSDIASAVWSAGTRTLTDLGSLAEDVWRVQRGGLGALPYDSFGYMLDKRISEISGGGGGSGFGGPYEVTFSFTDAEDISVGSVIFTVDGVGSAVTDGDGRITVNLPAGEYIVRAVPQQGVLFSPVSFSVTGNTIVKVRGSMRGITYASYDGTCRFVQRVVDSNGNPVSGITATLTILDLPTGVDGNRWPVGTVYTVTSDSQGKIVFPAVPAGTRVRVEIPSLNFVRELVAPVTSLMTIY